MPPLRYYQTECQNAVFANISAGKLDNLCVEPTGAGKSIIMAAIAKKVLGNNPKKKVLFISHRKELDIQNAAAFLELNPEKAIGFEKAEIRCPQNADAMFASILTVGKEDIARIRTWCNPREIAAVFFDEAHHLPGGKTYQTLYKELKAENPEIAVIGLTATPERADGELIGDYLPNLAHEVELEELIEAGYLAGIKGVSVKTETSLAGVHSQKGEFVEKELSERINNDLRNALAARIYKENHQGEKAMVFAVNKNHAHSISEAFSLQGIKITTITEDTPKEERDSLKTDIQSGKVDVIVSVGCLTEGFDYPGIKVILGMRPTKSPVLLAQMIGRGMRLIFTPDPKTPDQFLCRRDLKTHCIVYDFVDIQAHEMGAKALIEIVGIPPEIDIELKGEDIRGISALLDMVAYDPLAAANLTQAKTAKEIRELLLPVDILAKIKKQKPRRDTDFPWTPGTDGSHYLALLQGELCKLSRDARGVFILEHPTLKVQLRKAQWAKREKVEISQEANPPAAKKELQAKTLTEAFKIAEKILEPALQYDASLLSKKAPWKKEAKSLRATRSQQNALSSKHILSPTELSKISKLEASQLLTLLEIKEKMLIGRNRLPSGRYEGVDIALVAIRNPAYLVRMLEKGSAKNWGVEDAIQAAVKTNPLIWMEKTHRGLYKRFIEERAAELTTLWDHDRPAVRAEIGTILEHDSSNLWGTIQNLAEIRIKTILERNPSFKPL